MKTTAISTILALLATGTTTANAGCYTSGDSWQDRGNARYHVERACKGYDGHQGAFQGVYAPGEAKSACVQGTGTLKYDFVVQNLNTGASFDLADADCVWRLENEINGCAQGGQSDVAGWRFR
ncbi:hypothetical protein GE09DRAFT_1220202 [Coniochaeta sp. 2T2.1]|nr:hypothetical protein GE09DRAFT_1220202 [Coniochaeta sp. 2T2.1]